MSIGYKSQLDPKKRYLQIALNSTLSDARSIIMSLPLSDRIIIEAGTPLIKHYGTSAISSIRSWYYQRFAGLQTQSRSNVEISGLLGNMIMAAMEKNQKVTSPSTNAFQPYIVADMKTMDRGATEVELAAQAGANAVVALGTAPPETLNAFIETCEANGIDAMIDMMHVEYPLSVLRSLKKPPVCAILHRGVDEENFNKESQLPLHEIRRIKGGYDILLSVAGGDTLREVQRSFFNDADIVVVWKSFYQSTAETAELATKFLQEVK
ncbi:MAG: orotidine 5'-phosphate decarboxylase / HUMPS family protein [Patescibacteria group bacterium]